MAISMDLRVLARKLEKSSDDLLVDASTKGPETFEKVASAIAAASTLLTSVADDIDKNASFKLTPQQLDEMAALASAFDESADPLLKKQASVLDEITGIFFVYCLLRYGTGLFLVAMKCHFSV